MVAVTPPVARWLASQLSLSHFVRRGDGSLEALTGELGDAPDLLAAVVLTTGCARATVEGAVDRAVAGGRVVVDLRESSGVGRLLVWAEGEGIHVLHAPAPESSTVPRRAAAERAAGVTHEIANALTAIAGWTRMATQGGPLPEHTRRALEVVQRSTQEALAAARSLLRTMRDSGAPTVRPSAPPRADASAVLSAVVQSLLPEARERGVTIQAEVAQVWTEAPAAVLRLIASNLVRNAVEAAQAGGAIRVQLAAAAPHVKLLVSDDGPGMGTKTLGRIFERYFTTKSAGTGLGLAMVREAVDAAGGSVEVESRLGEGTQFRVLLPAARPAAVDRAAIDPPQDARSSGVRTKPRPALHRVLVVDDDASIRSLLTTALELHGAEVHVATDRATALSAASGRRFDLALVDLVLGTDRGDALIEDLRAAGHVELAVLMTGLVEPELNLRGGGLLLRKPFELSDLRRVLDQIESPAACEADG